MRVGWFIISSITDAAFRNPPVTELKILRAMLIILGRELGCTCVLAGSATAGVVFLLTMELTLLPAPAALSFSKAAKDW